MINAIWLFWVAMQVLLSIILLNFLIAIISQSYEEVMNRSVITKLQQKSDLNQEAFGFINFIKSHTTSEDWYIKMFGINNGGIFIVSNTIANTYSNEWTGFVSKI